jgi:hypothetical protein
MLCPLAKSNAAAMVVAYGGGTTYRIDREKERELFQCDEGNCGWWDQQRDRCCIVTIAASLEIISDSGILNL